MAPSQKKITMRGLCVLSLLCAGITTCARADLIESEEQLTAVREQLAVDYHRVPLPLLWYFKTDPDDRGAREGWFNVTRPDNSWAKIRANERWENQGFPGYDGVAWYLSRVQVPEGWTSVFIRFPAVDDAYTLYVDGKEVCRDGDRSRSVWNWSTCHEITDYVQAGREVTIILRVEDYMLQGGLTRGPVELLNFTTQIDITADWRFAPDYTNVGVTEGWYAPRIDDSHWRRVEAGRNWEYYGYEFDGFGWYRKWITVPAGWADQRVFLELPKVDDYFDLYLDGEFIHHFGTPQSPCWATITCVDVTRYVVGGQRHLLCLRVEDLGQPGGLGGSPCTLSAQMPIYRLEQEPNYAYLYADRAEGAPHIGPYPRETAIEGHAFQGLAPTLLAGENVTWSLVRGPVGLHVDSITGALSWDAPTTGPEAFLDWDLRWDHPIVVKARNDQGYDYASVQLKVLDNKGPALQVVRTQYIDWVVTADEAAWFETMQPHRIIDRQWEHMRWLLGHEPSYGRQCVKYQYNIGNRGWSGSPTIIGPPLWSADPVDGWNLGIWLHEVGHNFNWQTPINEYASNGPYDGMYHHFVEILIQYMLHRSLEDPERFDFTAPNLALYREHVNRVRTEAQGHYQAFLAWVQNNNDAADYPGDQYGVWKGLLIDLLDRFGTSALEKCLRAMRSDGIPRELRQTADAVEKKNALIFCILSHAAGSDLREYFRQRKFRFDDAYYTQIDAQIGAILRLLPDEDVGGWKRHPVTGHYYRRTPFTMTWCEAEDYAQSVGGHLVCLNGEQELGWLCPRFEIYGEVWIGLYRDAGGSWRQPVRGQRWLPTWHAGYPLPAPDYRFAALDLIAQKVRSRNDQDVLFGIIEAEALPGPDDPGFLVSY
jgi:hypothetical protein